MSCGMKFPIVMRNKSKDTALDIANDRKVSYNYHFGRGTNICVEE